MEKEEQNQISFDPFGDTLTSYDSTIIMDLGSTFLFQVKEYLILFYFKK